MAVNAVGGLMGGYATESVTQPGLPTRDYHSLLLRRTLHGPLAGVAELFLEDMLSPGCPTAIPEKLKSQKPEESEETWRQLVSYVKGIGFSPTLLIKGELPPPTRRTYPVGGRAAPILAFVVMAGFLFIVWWLMSGHLTIGADLGLVGTVVGYVSAKADMVISYYFGSSAGQDHIASAN